MLLLYRDFGKLDWKVSSLGFGCMRLPIDQSESGSGNIDDKEAMRMVRHAIDQGVTYLDSAYRYHNGGSEIFVGKALKDGYRDKVKVATKAPMPLIKTAADYDRILDEQLKKLDMDYIDYYLFHGLGKKGFELIKEQDIFAHAEAAQKAGKIGHLGFSFHETYDSLVEIIDGYNKWALCQVQYNFMDTEYQAGTKGVQYAASKGLAVVVMEPLRGGKLTRPIKEVSDCLERHGYKGTMADLALRWVWNQPEVSVILSGMSTMDQVVENLATADNSAPGSMSKDELALVKELEAVYRRRTGIPCTACGYCVPCPQGIDIPGVIRYYNEGTIYDAFDDAKRAYNMFGGAAGKCVQCKECEEKCPQSVPVSEWMPKIKEIFEPA